MTFAKLLRWIAQNRNYLLFFTGLVCIAYVNSLGNAFLSDDFGIVKNVHDPQFIFSQSIVFLRQLLNFIIFSIGGLNPTFFRLPNILFHTANVFLIFAFLSASSKKKVGFFAASLYAIHPILVESVTWISGGVYIQYAFFFLLSLFTYILSKHNQKLFFVSLASFVLSLLSSDKAAVFILVLGVYELALGDIRKNWKRLLPYVALTTLFALLYLVKVGQRVAYLQTEATNPEVGGGIDNPLIQIPYAITSYFELIVWPNMLAFYHSELSFPMHEYIIRLATFLLFIGALLLSFKKNREVFFWGSFFVISLLPTLLPFRLSWIVAERYAYLGSLGIFIIIALGIAKLAEKKKFQMPLYTAFAIVLIALTIRTMVRNIDWQNQDNLWLATARTSPSSAQNHNNLGDYYGRHGDRERAAKEFQIAIALKPNYADAYHNLGNAYRDMGRFDDALEQYKKALSFYKGLWQSYQNIAAIYFEQKKYDEAITTLEEGIKETYPEGKQNLYATLGILYYKLGDKQKALEAVQKALTIDPKNDQVKQLLLQMQNG